eukprot:s5401_g3.t1
MQCPLPGLDSIDEREFEDFLRGWQLRAGLASDTHGRFAYFPPRCRISGAALPGRTLCKPSQSSPPLQKWWCLRRYSESCSSAGFACRGRLDPLGDHIAACVTSAVLAFRALPVERADARVCHEAGEPKVCHALRAVYDRLLFENQFCGALRELLRGCGKPDVEQLAYELAHGMPVIGHIRPTPRWLPRTDKKYSALSSFEAFQRLNESHVRERLDRHRVGDEWEVILTEVMQEVRKGRMEGPFRAPAGWKKPTVPVQGHPGLDSLLECPDAHPCIAWAFSVVQEGSYGNRKVRRCEDYRRSFHNDTIEAFDVPPHDDISVYVSLVRHLATLGEFAMIWAQDLHSAYRQYPVESSSHCYVVVMTLAGAALWRHRVMPFGATASVSHFNKVTDALPWLARTMLFIPAIHYVDDLRSVDPASSSESSFLSFDSFCSMLGFRLTPAKRQPPGTEQKLQGVVVRIAAEGVFVAPSESRLFKLRQSLRQTLLQDRLTPD